MKNEFTLLITGCISPAPDVPFLALSESDIRRRQYAESILFYISETSAKRIVYCDNSGASPDETLFERAKRLNKEFEWLSFDGNKAKCIEHGKGYGEGEIINYALNNSQLLSKSDYLIKVTGRVIIRNFNFLIHFMSNKNTYFQRNSESNVDTRFYGIPIDIYKGCFRELYQKVDDKQHKYLENVFSDAIQVNNIQIKSFAVYPDVRGISGSTGLSYNVPLLRRIKLTIKNWIR